MVCRSRTFSRQLLAKRARLQVDWTRKSVLRSEVCP